jgi:hypothetical protein
MDRHADLSVFWVHAGSVARFYESYRDISDEAKIPGRDDASADVMRLVHKWLCSSHNGSWCLILDILDDASILSSSLLSKAQASTPQASEGREGRSLRSCIPRCSHGFVLVTSRFRDAAYGVVGDYDFLFEVDRMTEPDAVRLIRTKLSIGDNDEPDALALAHELDCVPLAVTQATAYIRRMTPRMTLQRYVREFQQSEANRLTLLEQSAADLRRDAGVPNAVIATWTISFQQIVAQYPAAAELLSLMSVPDSQGIPEFLLRPEGDNGQLEFENRLDPLVGFSLITHAPHDQAIRLHPLVQLAMRKWLARNDELQRWQRHALWLLSERFPWADHTKVAECRLLLPHAEMVMSVDFNDEESRLQQATLYLEVFLHEGCWVQLRPREC